MGIDDKYDLTLKQDSLILKRDAINPQIASADTTKLIKEELARLNQGNNSDSAGTRELSIVPGDLDEAKLAQLVAELVADSTNTANTVKPEQKADETKMPKAYVNGKEMTFESKVSVRVWQGGNELTCRDENGKVMDTKEFAKKYPEEYRKALSEQLKAAAADYTDIKGGKINEIKTDENGQMYIEIEINGKKVSTEVPVDVRGVLESFGIAMTEIEEDSEETPATPPAAENPADEKPAASTAVETGTEKTEQNPENRYKGENKPASTANWSDLNGKYFEVIDEPDADGNIPTRPIHGDMKVEGEAKNGENPKKFTITDKDNGKVYTFELDENAEGKVVYRCTSGPGGAYKQGNDYELRTINGVPMLVQMKDSEGFGLGVGKSRGTKPADKTETPPTPATPATPVTPPTPPATEVEEGEKMTPEERQAKIDADAAAIAPDFSPKKKVDEDLKKDAEIIRLSKEQGPLLVKLLKAELEAFWTSNSKAQKLLSDILPESVAYVVESYPDIADKIDNVMGFDREQVFDYVLSKLLQRANDVGLAPYTINEKPIDKSLSLEQMKDCIKKISEDIRAKDAETQQASEDNIKEVEDEKEQLKKFNEEKALFDAANKNLATAANADPKLKVLKDAGGVEFVTLPNGQIINVTRDKDGKIIEVVIQANEGGDIVNYSKDYAMGYASRGKVPNDRYDWNKILELINKIFGEAPAAPPAGE